MRTLIAAVCFWSIIVVHSAISQSVDDDPSMFEWYKTNVYPTILKNKHDSLYKTEKETRTVIFIVINKSGEIVSSFIEEPSNVKAADEAALAIAPLGLQFPAIPENIYKKPLGVKIPIVFKKSAVVKPFESSTKATRIVNSLSGTTCEIGSDCKFGNKIYTCNYATVVSIINSVNRIEKAEELVRSKDCEIQPDNTTFKVDVTSSPDIIYLSKDEKHVGYSPINLFIPVEQNELQNKTQNESNTISNISPNNSELRSRTIKDTKFIDRFIDQKGGCPRAAIHLNPRSMYWNDQAPLGKLAREWTESDISDLGRMYVECHNHDWGRPTDRPSFSKGYQRNERAHQREQQISESARRQIGAVVAGEAAAKSAEARRIEEYKRKTEEEETNRRLKEDKEREEAAQKAQENKISGLKSLYSSYLMARMCFEENKNYITKDDFENIKPLTKAAEEMIISTNKEITKTDSDYAWKEATKEYESGKKHLDDTNKTNRMLTGRSDVPDQQMQIMCRINTMGFVELQEKLQEKTNPSKSGSKNLEKDF